MYAIGQTERQSRIEWLQLLGLVGLMLAGVLFIYSATHARVSDPIPWHKELFIRQMFWCFSGVGLGALVCLIDYRSLSRWSMVGYWIMIVLLVLVLIPHIGTIRGGAQAMVRFKNLSASAFGIREARVHFRIRKLSQPPGRRIARTADFFQGAGTDRAALSLNPEGTGPWLGADFHSHGTHDDAGRWCATQIPRSFRRHRGGAGGAFPRGYFIRAARLVDRSNWRIINGTGCWFISEKISQRRMLRRMRSCGRGVCSRKSLIRDARR